MQPADMIAGRVELRSRGKSAATGLSGVSNPSAKAAEDALVLAGEANCLEDSGVDQQTDFRFEVDNNPYYDAKTNQTQQFEASGGHTFKYRDSLNMSQPVPKLDNSSILGNSIQCNTEEYNA